MSIITRPALPVQLSLVVVTIILGSHHHRLLAADAERQVPLARWFNLARDLQEGPAQGRLLASLWHHPRLTTTTCTSLPPPTATALTTVLQARTMAPVAQPTDHRLPTVALLTT